MVKQNAAMVEESTAASHSLSQEAESLSASVSRFQIGAVAEPVRIRSRQGPRPVQSSVTALRSVGGGASALRPRVVANEDGWEEF
ncbi:hypothetical protein [Brevundimonas sp. Root1279]|uniref:hypothetical protein n=1 Tax=Brevundimonas sp. Root1279 TaxID=1736443 RepID=UPI0006F31E42|nr:hypothetical protein [Brevundimonas sp. Root1279]KQW78897.1 hypothetical protein ASC65_16475 [Brevundimonas sp. Root1279]